MKKTLLLLLLLVSSIASFANVMRSESILYSQDDDSETDNTTEESWTDLGTGKFMDTFWIDDDWTSSSLDVNIQRSTLNVNRYRIVDPYKGYDLGGQGDDFYFTIYSKGDSVRADVNAPFDGFVVYEPCNTGYYYSSYGAYIYVYHPVYFKSLRTNEEAMAKNRVEDYMEDGTPGYIICSSYYYMDGVGGWNYTTMDAIKIQMPGYYLADYSATVEYRDTVETADSLFAVANITLAKDVSYAKIGIVAGAASQEGLDSVMSSGTVITQGGEYKFAMPENAKSGKYTIYAVTFNDEGVNEDYAYDTFKYVTGGATSWTPKYVGTWTYTTAFANEDGTPYDDENLILSQCDEDPDIWKIDNLWNGVSFCFTWNQETNKISFESQSTGVDGGYGYLYVDDMSEYGYESSYYDPENKTFNFDIYYEDGTYSWGYGFEQFKITADGISPVTAGTAVQGTRKYMSNGRLVIRQADGNEYNLNGVRVK